jgi:beta-glucanase (GH16 family)
MKSFLPLLAASLFLACAPIDEEEETASSEDSLKACAASKKMDWQIHMNEDFEDGFPEDRFHKFDGVAPPRTSTCYVASNVTVSKGMLRLAAKKGSGCQGQPYTGAAVDSYGKFWTGKYFKAEIRAKASQQKGIFAAPLWFRPGTSAGAQNVGGEIDVAEILGAGKHETPKVHTTLHADYSMPDTHVHEATKLSALGDDDGEGFHVYRVEKTPKGITFSIDDKHVAGWGCGHSDNDKRPAWFDQWFEENPQGWSLRIDNKVGGPWAGEPDMSTMWGEETTLVIDWIKVWKPKT